MLFQHATQLRKLGVSPVVCPSGMVGTGRFLGLSGGRGGAPHDLCVLGDQASRRNGLAWPTPARRSPRVPRALDSLMAFLVLFAVADVEIGRIARWLSTDADEEPFDPASR